MYRIAECLSTALAPILSFTSEEVWQLLPGSREESVHLAEFPSLDDVSDAPEADTCMKRLLGLRERALAALEELRQGGSIGKAEEARLYIGGDTTQLDTDLASTGLNLATLLIVSRADAGDVTDGLDVPAYPGLEIRVAPYEAPTCSRCWRRFDELVQDADLPGLCSRCHEVVTTLLEEGRAELGEPKG
jgi:isoleucyl-tRNA synthetase